MEMVRMPMATVLVHHGASFLSPFQPTTLCPTLRLHTAGAPRRHQANQVKVKVVTTGISLACVLGSEFGLPKMSLSS